MIIIKLLRKIDEYTNVGTFELVYKHNKIKISYYDEILDFNDKNIVIKVDNNKKIICKGNNLVIENLYKELIIISGSISNISFGEYNE